MFRHVRDQFVEHAALPEQRVRPRLAGIRFQQTVHAKALADSAQQRQQGGGEGADQQQTIGRRKATNTPSLLE